MGPLEHSFPRLARAAASFAWPAWRIAAVSAWAFGIDRNEFAEFFHSGFCNPRVSVCCAGRTDYLLPRVEIPGRVSERRVGHWLTRYARRSLHNDLVSLHNDSVRPFHERYES